MYYKMFSKISVNADSIEIEKPFKKVEQSSLK